MSQKPSSSYSKLHSGKSAAGEGSLVGICDFCGKKFNSGKALGGHRRYHIQSQRKMEEQRKKVSHTLRIKSKNLVIRDNNNNLIKSNSIGNPNDSSGRCFRCLVCNKDFPSEKSLCGHMRSHPDRDWRGMNPPFVTTDNALASSSSSEELMKEQDHQNHNKSSSPSTSEESLSVPVDPSSSCSESSWLKKDMRGRKRIGEAEAAHIKKDMRGRKRIGEAEAAHIKKDMRGRKRIGEAEAAHIAAQTLMDMHLFGNYHLPHRLPTREPTPEKAAVLPVKKRKKNVMKNHLAGSSSSPAGTKSLDNCKEKIEGSDGNEELKADMKVISLKKEKKNLNKKMKLGSEMIKSEEETVKQEVKASQRDVCDLGNKSFPCFQALVGHKTKHRKNIVKSMKGKEVVEQRQEEEQVEEEDKICINGALSGEEAAALISSEERLVISSNDNENNSNEEEVEETRQQSASKTRDFDLNVPFVFEDEATDL
ncbi:hypothetical protein K1719_014277 [Acacia pycnantha]|nr:hypothetical protein K1719_014277 [Acacia pycnantha]